MALPAAHSGLHLLVRRAASLVSGGLMCVAHLVLCCVCPRPSNEGVGFGSAARGAVVEASVVWAVRVGLGPVCRGACGWAAVRGVDRVLEYFNARLEGLSSDAAVSFVRDVFGLAFVLCLVLLWWSSWAGGFDGAPGGPCEEVASARTLVGGW